MLPKYTVEYTTQFKKHAQPNQYGTDDPVACEEFVQELLARGLKVQDIKHDGLSLPMSEFDNLIKIAAEVLAAKQVCTSLGIDREQAHYRFGLPA